MAIIDAAALSFLGLGNPDDRQPEWGQMLGRRSEFIYDAPHLAFYPARAASSWSRSGSR